MKQPGEEKKRTGSLADGNRQDVCHHVLERATLGIVLSGIFVLRWEWL